MTPHGVRLRGSPDQHRYCGKVINADKDGPRPFVRVRWDDPPDGPPPVANIAQESEEPKDWWDGDARPEVIPANTDLPDGAPRAFAADARKLLGVASGQLYEKVFLPMWRLLIPIAVRHRNALAAYVYARTSRQHPSAGQGDRRVLDYIKSLP